MLKFRNSFTNDSEVDSFLRTFLNNALKKSTFQYCVQFGRIIDLREKFKREKFRVPKIFPASYPGTDEDKAHILAGLYSLLNSDKEFVPTLIMQYALAKMLELEIQTYEYNKDAPGPFEDADRDEYDSETLREIDEDIAENHTPDKSINCPFSVDMRYKIIYAYYLEKMTREEAEKKVDSLWHYSEEWFTFCFLDDSYKMLDNLTPSDHSWSELDNPVNAVFYIPCDWKESKDFRFLTPIKGGQHEETEANKLSIEFKWYERALTLAKEIGGLEDTSKEFGKPENCSLSLFVVMYSLMREHSDVTSNRQLLNGIVHELSKTPPSTYINSFSEDEPAYYLAQSFSNEHDRVVRNSISSLTRRILFFLYQVESGKITSNDIDTVYCEKPVDRRINKRKHSDIIPPPSRRRSTVIAHPEARKQYE